MFNRDVPASTLIPRIELDDTPIIIRASHPRKKKTRSKKDPKTREPAGQNSTEKSSKKNKVLSAATSNNPTRKSYLTNMLNRPSGQAASTSALAPPGSEDFIAEEDGSSNATSNQSQRDGQSGSKRSRTEVEESLSYKDFLK